MSMHYCQQGRVKYTHWVVYCKQCKRAVDTGLSAFPRDNIVIECPLCGELRRYRPSEVYRGFPHQRPDGRPTWRR